MKKIKITYIEILKAYNESNLDLIEKYFGCELLFLKVFVSTSIFLFVLMFCCEQYINIWITLYLLIIGIFIYFYSRRIETKVLQKFGTEYKEFIKYSI